VRGTRAAIVVPVSTEVRSSTTPSGSIFTSWSGRGRLSSSRVMPASDSGTTMPCGPSSRCTLTRYVIVTIRVVGAP